MASAIRLHRQGSPHGCQGRRHLQDVVHELHDRPRVILSAASIVNWCHPNAFATTDKFDDPNLPGEMQTTVTLKQVSCGTEINIVQEGIPEAIPLEMCYLGWQESLAQLAQSSSSPKFLVRATGKLQYGTSMLRGGCLCGQIRYEIVGPVGEALYCHCSMCRKSHGTAFPGKTRGSEVIVPFRPGRGLADELPLVRGYDQDLLSHLWVTDGELLGS